MLVEPLQLRPQSRLERELRSRRAIGKHRDERAQLHGIVIARAELREVRGERARCGTRAERWIGPNDVRVLMHYALPDQTRKAGIVHEAREFPFDLDCANHVGNPSRLRLVGGRSRSELDRTTLPMHDEGRRAPKIRGGQDGSIVLRDEAPQQSPLPNERMSDTAPTSTLKGYIPTLDGWRAIAILGVMVSHAGHSYSAALGRESVFDHFALGTHGVNLFFAISGLLITSRLLEEWDNSGRISLKRFYVRRAFRILPPALLYLSCVALLGALGFLPVVREELAAATLFFRNYLPPILGAHGAGFFTSHYWSLGVEEHFYLFWPALLLFAGRKRALPVAITIAVLIAVWRHVEAWREIMLYNAIQPTYFARSDTRIDSIMWGVVAALALARPDVRAMAERYLSTIVYLAFVALYGVITYRYGTRPTFWEASIVPILIVGTVLRPRSMLARVLETPAMRWIGRLSYSLYLWEFFFVYYPGVPTTLGVWQTFPVNVIAAVACATASYYLVERPLIRVGHRLAPAMPREALVSPDAAVAVIAAA